MKYYIKLLRPKDWAKNVFLFIPIFFAKHLFVSTRLELLVAGFFSFCCVASSIYILNDYHDIENDKKHPVKSKRPLASGKVKPKQAIIICIVLVISGCGLGYIADMAGGFLIILASYFLMNVGYSFGLKNIAILDMLILAAGFILRVKGGAVISHTYISDWLIIMTFLLALFMAIGKRRDDVLLLERSGAVMRKSVSGYNLDFLNTMIGLFGAIIIVAYINYTVSPSTITRLGTHRLYYSSVFVIAGIMRYLQVVFVKQNSGSPTEILYRDRFIQVTIFLWIISVFILLYLPNSPLIN